MRWALCVVTVSVCECVRPMYGWLLSLLQCDDSDDGMVMMVMPVVRGVWCRRGWWVSGELILWCELFVCFVAELPSTNDFADGGIIRLLRQQNRTTNLTRCDTLLLQPNSFVH